MTRPRRQRHDTQPAAPARRALAAGLAALYLIVALSAGLAFRPIGPAAAQDGPTGAGETLAARIAITAVCHGAGTPLDQEGGRTDPSDLGGFACPACLLAQTLSAPLPAADGTGTVAFAMVPGDSVPARTAPPALADPAASPPTRAPPVGG